MDPQDTIDLSREALTMVGIVGGPILVAGLVIGLIVGIFQAMTQIQDQTVSAVPKILGMLAVTLLVLPWVSERMVDYTREALGTPMISGFAPAPVAAQESPFKFASATTRLYPDLPNTTPGPVARVAANVPPLVAPPLKSPTSSMPMMSTRPSSMPIHRHGQSSGETNRGESSMPQFRGGNSTTTPEEKIDLEG